MNRAILAVVCLIGLGSSAWAQTTETPRPAPAKAEVSAPPEYPDLPLGSWEYKVVEVLIKTKLINPKLFYIYPNDPMTRWEFAVLIARFWNSSDLPQEDRVTQNIVGRLRLIVEAKAQNLSPALNAAALTDGLVALRREFANEIGRLSLRVYADPGERVPVFENRVPSPPKQTFSLGLLHRFGIAPIVPKLPTPSETPAQNPVPNASAHP